MVLSPIGDVLLYPDIQTNSYQPDPEYTSNAVCVKFKKKVYGNIEKVNKIKWKIKMATFITIKII